MRMTYALRYPWKPQCFHKSLRLLMLRLVIFLHNVHTKHQVIWCLWQVEKQISDFRDIIHDIVGIEEPLSICRTLLEPLGDYEYLTLANIKSYMQILFSTKWQTAPVLVFSVPTRIFCSASVLPLCAPTPVGTVKRMGICKLFDGSTFLQRGLN